MHIALRKLGNACFRRICNRSKVTSVTVEVGGKPLSFTVNKLARIADGAVDIQMGDTSVLVTAVSSPIASESLFLPLRVDYREKAAAAGRIPPNYFRRELRATDREIITSRSIDRVVRAFFPRGFTNETQIVGSLLSADGVHDPDVLSINGASAALTVSGIPWNGPIGAVRVGLIDGEYVLNPTKKELLTSDLNLVVASTDKKIVMVEAASSELPEDVYFRAVELGFEECKKIVRLLLDLQRKAGKVKRNYDLLLPTAEICTAARESHQSELMEILTEFHSNKVERGRAAAAAKERAVRELKERYPAVSPATLEAAYNRLGIHCLNDIVLERGTRFDGRSFTDLRPMECEVGLKKPLHGSALFQRGQTQVFTTLTFDSQQSAKKTDLISAIIGGSQDKEFMVHYEFPPFCNNEIGFILQHNRREIGHGALTENALRPVVPEEFPFTIRLTSQVLESNGSSSMASICAGSLALMDAAVPISSSVAGVACGLVAKENDESGDFENYRILTDISGLEDALGGMDFKVAGTRDGITACQLDVKSVRGLPLHVFKETLEVATKGRHKVLDVMDETMSEARTEPNSNRPVYETITVPAVKRYKFLGPGGYRIRKLTEETGVGIEPVGEEEFSVYAPTPSMMQDAKQRIETLLSEAEDPEMEFGAVYTGTIVDIRDFGVMIELFKGVSPALVHNSQLDHRKVYHPSVLNLKLGQEMTVKYLGRDPSSGRIRLSRKALLPPPADRDDQTSAHHRRNGGKTKRTRPSDWIYTVR
ncbi:polyribonucleotide nucleotidyltransferase 1, mitochondrial-like isoform X2 [Oscarella lobularis]|uniref:polyribonucleotide nucleotidyltransferase 1, mitochondrial-like isoform X2 n=1 Tax=Oscarella lobularis TaxID=121494 RepID=UPI0033142E78